MYYGFPCPFSPYDGALRARVAGSLRVPAYLDVAHAAGVRRVISFLSGYSYVSCLRMLYMSVRRSAPLAGGTVAEVLSGHLQN